MYDHSITTRNPLLFRERVEVFTFATVGAERLPIRFSKDVAWIAECEAKFDYSHGGKSITDGTAFGDHSYGFMSCLRSAIQDAQRAGRYHSVTSESSLVIACRATIKLTAVLLDTEQDHFGGKQYNVVPRTWYRDFNGIEQALEKFWKDGEEPAPTFLSEMRERDPLSEVVWSSALDEAENERALAEFKERATAFVQGASQAP